MQRAHACISTRMLTRRSLYLAFVLLSACMMPGAAQNHRFAGVWEARFQGEVFMRLKLQAADTVSGTLSGGHIDVNREGDITNASGGGKELPISNVTIDGDKMLFDWKEDDDETSKLSFKLTGDGQAELQFLNIPEGAKMKPIRLTKS